MGENHPYEKYNVLSINHLYFHHPETPDPIPWTGLPSRTDYSTGFTQRTEQPQPG